MAKNEKKDIESPETEGEDLERLTPLEQAKRINKKFVLWSLGSGVIPIPVIDIAAILTTQITMLAQMTKVYDIPFSEHRIKNIMIPLLSSIGFVPIGTVLLASAAKFIPLVGQTAGIISLPVISGAVSYATGKIFICHFEAGGTLLDFDPDKMKSYYKKLFDEGRLVATRESVSTSGR